MERCDLLGLEKSLDALTEQLRRHAPAPSADGRDPAAYCMRLVDAKSGSTLSEHYSHTPDFEMLVSVVRVVGLIVERLGVRVDIWKDHARSR